MTLSTPATCAKDFKTNSSFIFLLLFGANIQKDIETSKFSYSFLLLLLIFANLV
jgi:hypothetical protein